MFRLKCRNKGENTYIAKANSKKIFYYYFIAVSFSYIGVSSLMMAVEPKHVAAN